MREARKITVILLVLLFIFTINILAAPPGMKDVTFKYEPQIDDIISVYLAGSFNNWATRKTGDER